LAVSEDVPDYNPRRASPAVRDIGGGEVVSRRVGPTTISIGSLVLRGVPTDILTGVEKDAPTLLGRDALYPFRLRFDPRKIDRNRPGFAVTIWGPVNHAQDARAHQNCIGISKSAILAGVLVLALRF